MLKAFTHEAIVIKGNQYLFWSKHTKTTKLRNVAAAGLDYWVPPTRGQDKNSSFAQEDSVAFQQTFHFFN